MVDAPLPLQQSPAFEKALRDIGQRPKRDANNQLILHRTFGPLSVHMLTRATIHSVPDNLKGAVILAPDHPVDLCALPLVSPATVAELDLTPSTAALHAGLRGKWRNRLRHAYTHNIRVTRQNLPIQPDHWILQAENTQQRLHKYRHWPAELTCAYARANKGDAKLFTAFYGSDAVAGLILLRHGSTATYHIGHTSTAGRIVSAQTRLMWAAICWAKSKGLVRLDLGTVDTETSPGLARFKLGTGAQLRKLGGTWLWHRRLKGLNGLRHIDARMMS